jgi:nucleotidyltransferase/DNA polymerase involved in DNA repair
VRAPDLPAWAFTRGARGGRPVVVLEGGRVAACSPVARRAGLAVGDPAQRASDLVPTADVRVRDRALESAAWEEAVARLNQLTPWLENEGDGRAVLAGADTPELAAVAAEAGLAVGVAVSRAHARIASLRAAAGALVTVHAGGERAFLRATPVEVLPAAGFEAEVSERLELLGYGTLGAAATLTRRHLDAQFGVAGRHLYELLHSVDDRPVPLYRPPAALCATVAFEDGFGSSPGEPAIVLPAVDHAAGEAAGALRGLLARRVTVRLAVRGERRPWMASRVLLEASGDSAFLARQARGEGLRLLDGLRSHDGVAEVEAVTVELGSLTPGTMVQGRLFRGRPDVYMAVRGVHRRFPGSIRRAVVALHAAFPEDSFHFEPYLESPPAGRRGAA